MSSQLLCRNCQKPCPPNRKKYCSADCMRKWTRRAWKLKNPDKVRQQIYRYYHRYRDKLLAKRRNDPAAKEYDRQRKRRLRQQDRERVRLAWRKWYKNNREKKIALTRSYKCRRNQEKMSAELWQLALLVESKLSGKK